MTTGEVSDLFFNCQFVENVCIGSRIHEDLLEEAAELFLEICPTAAEGGITKEWLMNDFLKRL